MDVLKRLRALGLGPFTAPYTKYCIFELASLSVFGEFI
jgi:hypothetical protein